MAQTLIIVVYLFFNLLSLSFLPCKASMSSDFYLKLIHRDSLDSPLYQPNISDFERFKAHIQISKARASYFRRVSKGISNRNSKKLKNTSLRLPLKYIEPLYTVEIDLGTPVVKRTLVFDTGTGLTWTQCKPCPQCFKQKEPLFDTRKSRSYRLLSTANNLSKSNSFTCVTNKCFYFIEYELGQFSAGIASIESFAFQSSAGVPQTVPNLVFGCGATSNGTFSPTNSISGVLGMNKGRVSFARQIESLIMGQFSYCLPKTDSKTKGSYVRFGGEAMIRGKNASTPLINIKQHPGRYAVNLTGITIGGQKLQRGKLGPLAFPEGFIIDTGSTLSILNQNAYSAAEMSLNRYFSKFKIYRHEVLQRLLCYRPAPKNFRVLPNMTFHFRGADYHVPSANLFIPMQDFFCLTIMPSNYLTILGTRHQQNVRIVYNLKRNILSFAPENC